MDQPVGEKRTQDATGTNHLHVTRDILWKTSALSSKRRYYTPPSDRKPEKYGVFNAIHSQAAYLHGGFAPGFARGLISSGSDV